MTQVVAVRVCSSAPSKIKSYALQSRQFTSLKIFKAKLSPRCGMSYAGKLFPRSFIHCCRAVSRCWSYLLGRLVSPNRPDSEKLSPYECGFEAFEDARMRFDVRYYLVAILFILFDLEIAFLFPWAIVLTEIGLFGYLAMVVFLAILVVGFAYEWMKGALEWE